MCFYAFMYITCVCVCIQHIKLIYSMYIIDLMKLKMAYETLWIGFKYFFSEPLVCICSNNLKNKTCWWAELPKNSFFWSLGTRL